MVLEALGESLRKVFARIAGATHVDEDLLKDVVRDIQRALLQADVNVALVKDLSGRVQKRSLEEKPPAGMSPREHVVRIIYQELVAILGAAREIPLGRQRILLVGLYGQGKTTTAAKIARHFQKKGSSVALVAADTHRPAAYDQLRQLGEQLGLPVHGDPREKDAVRIAREGLKRFEGTDVVLCDSSGRHALEKDLIEEIRRVAKAFAPTETVLVLDAAVGQQAGPQAKAFHDAVGVTSVIVTKLDGTAKGGGALSAVAATKAPIVFVGTGEKVEDLERFDPPRFLSRLLGMGDLASLMERAQEAIDTEAAEETARKILSGKFTLHEMYEQIEAMGKMGALDKLLSMLPGAGNLPKEQMDQTQVRLRKFKVIMESMTDAEMTDPKSIKSSRIVRIARGAGMTTQDVKELLKHYAMSQKAVKGFTSNRKMKRQLMKQMQAGNLPME